MDPLRILVEQAGFFTRAEARDLGHDDRSVAALVRGRAWHRIRRGYFTYLDHWEKLDDVGRHVLTAHTVLRSLGPTVALSHVTAAAAHGVPVWGLPLDRVHVTRLDGGTGRVDAGVVHHEGRALERDLVTVDGHRVVAADRAAVEAATLAGGEEAFCLFEAVLNRGLADPDALGSRFDAMKAWPGTRQLHIPIRMATGGSASVGEARGFWLCRTFHLPAPERQFEVRDSAGTLLGTSDWGWPAHGLLGEFDGQVKYGRLLTPGQEAGDVVFAEKHREDLLREATGYRMFRAIWTDYDRPRVTVARLSRLLGL
jgi:hypothetical protein